ncbi:uncharacterized protein METZ01_LOCUS430899, partial [marine metagenome]
GDFVAINKGVEPIGGRTRGRAKEMVKTMINRAAFQGTRVIDATHCRQTILVDGFAFLIKGRQTHVPFTEHRRGISLLLQQTGHGKSTGIDQAGPSHPGEDSPVIEPESHAAGENTVTGGRANGGGTVSVGKPDAFLRQLVQMRRGYLALVVVTTHITVTEIISKDEEDIGFISGI